MGNRVTTIMKQEMWKSFKPNTVRTWNILIKDSSMGTFKAHKNTNTMMIMNNDYNQNFSHWQDNLCMFIARQYVFMCVTFKNLEVLVCGVLCILWSEGLQQEISVVLFFLSLFQIVEKTCLTGTRQSSLHSTSSSVKSCSEYYSYVLCICLPFL